LVLVDRATANAAFLVQTQACSNQIDMQQRAQADRLALDPLIEVEAATWSQARSSIGWVKERAGIVGARTRCRRPPTVDSSC
jgi:hypothetical protein